MKKLTALLIGLFAMIVFTAPSQALAGEISLYGPYDSHQELLEAYEEAVDAGDVEKQEELLEIGRASLDYLIAEGEAASDDLPATRANPSPNFSVYFSSGQWITRNGVVSLSLYPINPKTWSTIAVGYAWDAVTAMYSSSSNWRNASVMREQFYCHALFAAWKTPWNLEPSKTSINPITCN